MARIFLCHASEDKDQVEEIYDRLCALGFAPWMDKRDLLPGQRWRQVIPQVLRDSNFVLVFLSQNSVSKQGYVQREFRLTLDALEEMPEDTIHTIPVRLDDCEVPSLFVDLHWANLFEPGGFERLIQAIRYSPEHRAPRTSAGEATRPTTQDVPQVIHVPHQDIVLPGEQPQEPQPEPEPVAATPKSAEPAPEKSSSRPRPETPITSSPQGPKRSSDTSAATRRTLLWSAVIGAVAVIMAAVIVLYKQPPSPSEAQRPRTEATRKKAPQPNSSSSSKPQNEISNSIGMEFVWIPAGTFTMGSPDSDANAYDDEKPAHQVTISEPFYMGKYEVTQGQWKAVMGTTIQEQRDKGNKEWLLRGVGGKHPMYYVSWDEVQAFIEKLNARGDRVSCRLPTEAQWEYAARAGSQHAYSFGDDAAKLGEYAWYDENSGGETHPVGTRKPNAWGLHDMHGNVWEWVVDGKRTYTPSAVTDPAGPTDAGARRVYRGGSWYDDALYARSADRSAHRPGVRDDGLGFRCLSSASEQGSGAQGKP